MPASPQSQAGWICPNCFRTVLEPPDDGMELCLECDKTLQLKSRVRKPPHWLHSAELLRRQVWALTYWVQYRSILVTLGAPLVLSGLGWILAGNYGLCGGLLIGAFAAKEFLRKVAWDESRAYFYSFFGYMPILASAANAEGMVTERVRLYLERRMRQRFKPHGLVLSLVIPIVRLTLAAPRSADKESQCFAGLQRSLGPSVLGSHLELDICSVLFASGDLTSGKMAWIQSFDPECRLEWRIMAYFTRQDVPMEERRRRSLAVLGLPETASEREIREAYKALARQYHPDVQGALPEHLKELVHHRMVSLNEAYSYLKDGPSCPKLFFRDQRGDAMQPSASAAFVGTCWICEAKLRIPPEAIPSSARCVECFALLGLHFNPNDLAAKG